MPAITLHQPWASLLVYGPKVHETRSWRPPSELIGERFLIHAAMRRPHAEEWSDELVRVLEKADVPMPLGSAVGTARLVGFQRIDDRPAKDIDGNRVPRDWQDRACGDWRTGRFAWRFVDPRPLDRPVRMRGSRRIWYANFNLTPEPGLFHGLDCRCEACGSKP